MLSFVITLIVLVLAGLGALWGLSRGLNRSLIRFGAVLLSAVIAFILATSLYPAMVATPLVDIGMNPADHGLANDATVNALLQSLLTSDPSMAQLFEASPTLRNFILMLPQALIAEVLFVLFFFVVKFVLGFIQIFFNIFLVRKKNRRLIAAGVGALQGVFCALVLLVPIFGLVPMMDQIVTTANTIATVDEDGNKSELFATIEQLGVNFCDPIKNDPAYVVFEFTGIRYLGTEVFYNLSNAQNDAGETHSVFREVNETVPAIMQAMKLSEVTFDELSEEEVAILQGLVSGVQDSTFLRGVLSELLINGSGAILDEDGFMGITLPSDMDENTSAIVTDLLTSLSESEPDVLVDDLPEIVDVVVSLVDIGLFSEDSAGIENLLSNKEDTAAFLLALANSHTLSPVAISAINNIGITTIGGIFELSQEEIDEMRIPDLNAFNNMTEIEREAEIEKIASTISALADLGEQMNQDSSTEIIDLFPQTGKMLNTMSSSVLLGKVSKAVVNGILNNEAAQGFLNEKTIETIRAKMESGGINFENTLSSIAAAHKLSQSLNTKPSAPPSEPSNPSNPSTPSNPSEPSNPSTPSEPSNPSNPSNPSTPSTPSEPSNPSVPSEPSTPSVTDQFIGAVEDLFVSMDETTAEIMKESMTEQIVDSMGVPEDAKEGATTIFDNLLDEMAKFEPTEDTDYQKEAEAVQSTLTFVTDIFEKPEEAITEEKLTEVLDTALQSQTVTNTLINSGAETTITNQLTEEQLNDVSNILDNYVNESTDSETVDAAIEALRNLLGVGSSLPIDPSNPSGPSDLPDLPEGFDPSDLLPNN